MSHQQMMNTAMEETPYLPQHAGQHSVASLTDAEQNEVIGFLTERPIHTVIMMSLIRDNGIVSDLNRGTFYGCRNSDGRLEGVALVGHATLIEARTRQAIQELALVAQIHEGLHMFMAEQDIAEQFWNKYADNGQRMRFACRELLFELKYSLEKRGSAVEGLRLATAEDLDLVAPVHAALAEAESGVNPLEKDRDGFLKRCLRRIEQGRVYVVISDGKLIFKADVQAETPEMIYLEGIYTDPDLRGQGIGRKCLTQLTSDLLSRTRSICVLVNAENERAHAFYRMCGFTCVSKYDTIFLSREQAV